MKGVCAVFIGLLYQTIDSASVSSSSMSACVAETHVRAREARRIDKLGIPLTKEGKCYAACVFKSVGIIDITGNISRENFMQLFREFSTSSVDEEREMQLVQRCSEQANDEDDECELATTFIKCFKDNVPPTLRTISITLPQTINLTLPSLLPSLTLALVNLG